MCAYQIIHMKYQGLFHLIKNNYFRKLFATVETRALRITHTCVLWLLLRIDYLRVNG